VCQTFLRRMVGIQWAEHVDCLNEAVCTNHAYAIHRCACEAARAMDSNSCMGTNAEGMNGLARPTLCIAKANIGLHMT
jgi:hypothetical protein